MSVWGSYSSWRHACYMNLYSVIRVCWTVELIWSPFSGTYYISTVRYKACSVRLTMTFKIHNKHWQPEESLQRCPRLPSWKGKENGWRGGKVRTGRQGRGERKEGKIWTTHFLDESYVNWSWPMTIHHTTPLPFCDNGTRSSSQWWSGRSTTAHIVFDLRSLIWGFGESCRLPLFRA